MRQGLNKEERERERVVDGVGKSQGEIEGPQSLIGGDSPLPVTGHALVLAARNKTKQQQTESKIWHLQAQAASSI